MQAEYPQMCWEHQAQPRVSPANFQQCQKQYLLHREPTVSVAVCSRQVCWHWSTRNAGSQRLQTKHWLTSCSLSTRHTPSFRSRLTSATKHTSAWFTTPARWTTAATSGCSRTWIHSTRMLSHCSRSHRLTLSKPSGRMVSLFLNSFLCLVCFDPVGWVSGRAFGL